MKVLFKGKEYSYVEYQHPNPDYGLMTKFVYANGEDLKYGDIADMFWVAMKYFLPFMEAVLAGADFAKGEYSSGYTFGYYPPDIDNEEILEHEVAITCLEEDTIITKKYFYELCIFLCDCKLATLSENDIELTETILNFKCQLQQKISSS